MKKQNITSPEIDDGFKIWLEKQDIYSWFGEKYLKAAFVAGVDFSQNLAYQRTIYNEFLARVFAELKSQDQKWGSQRRKHPLEWQSILVEEVGEIAKEVCDNNFQATLPTNYEQELIQAAAVLFRMYAQNRINLFGEDFKKSY